MLHVLPRHCWLRQGCIRIVTHRYFDRLAVGVITTYVLILGLSDFSVVDGSLNPVGMGYKYQDGHLVQASSGQNRVVELSRAPFTLLLFVHCILTMLAMGLQGKGSYTRDGKNLADLFILAARYTTNAVRFVRTSSNHVICVTPLVYLGTFQGHRTCLPSDLFDFCGYYDGC